MKQSICYHLKRAGRRLSYVSVIAIAIVSAFVTSCAVVFVGPYDEITDKAISDLAMKTEEFLAKMEATGGDYESNRSLYREAKASIRSIRLRAEVYEKNEGELKELDLLDENFDNLAKLHRLGSLTGMEPLLEGFFWLWIAPNSVQSANSLRRLRLLGYCSDRLSRAYARVPT